MTASVNRIFHFLVWKVLYFDLNFIEVCWTVPWSMINPSHKSHNASDKYPTVTIHHFVTEMCTHVHISVTNWCIVGYGTGALLDLCNRSIDYKSSLIQVMPWCWSGNQPLLWPNDDPVLWHIIWCHVTSLGRNDLNDITIIIGAF